MNRQTGVAKQRTPVLIGVACLVIAVGLTLWKTRLLASTWCPKVGLGACTKAYFNPNPDYYSHTPTMPTKITIPAGWLTYHSTKSSIQFSYPPDWKLVKNDTSQSLAWELERVTLVGTNKFSLSFDLEQDHVNPALTCANSYRHTAISVNELYVMVPEGRTSDKTEIISLRNTQYPRYKSEQGCWLGFYANPVDDKTGFLFSGSFADKMNNTLLSLPTNEFLAKPEVQAAKTVFSTFKQ